MGVGPYRRAWNRFVCRHWGHRLNLSRSRRVEGVLHLTYRCERCSAIAPFSHIVMIDDADYS